MSVPETPRKAIPKRLRFEVMRRDNHACRYCGRTAPEVKLTIDHVTPVALGGTDDPSNLATACTECNSGKASTTPDAALVADVAQDALRWSEAMRLAAEVSDVEVQRRRVRYEGFSDLWGEYYTDFRGNLSWLPRDWRFTLDQLHAAGASWDLIVDSVEVVVGRNPDDPWRYFCGVAWKKVAQLQDRARAILDTEGPPRGA